MVANRVRQIREGSEYLVSSPKNEDIVVALREIAATKVHLVKNTAQE
jgi:DNA-directed RNA polymerase subunit omega